MINYLHALLVLCLFSWTLYSSFDCMVYNTNNQNRSKYSDNYYLHELSIQAPKFKWVVQTAKNMW